jgi:hypothetical protein
MDLNIIFNKLTKSRKDFINNNPLKKEIIIDIEENKLKTNLEKRNNKYLKNRDNKKFLKPTESNIKFFILINTHKFQLKIKISNNIIKFISNNTNFITINSFKNNIIIFDKILFQVFNNDKLLYELKLNNNGILENIIFENKYKENIIKEKQISIGKYNTNKNEVMNYEIIFIHNKDNNYDLKHLSFYNETIIEKIKNIIS